ncbi:MAG TPA: enoyl-CoA hydratase/isomerase family protein [Actinobacteria bacterium]|nr:enoyl-CoA hydratase/isomerase family protein [Actinomycetota bacterium]
MVDRRPGKQEDDVLEGYQRLRFDTPAPGVLEVVISDPERLNAVDAVGHRELAYVWPELARLDEVRAVLLRGEGDAFSAGGSFDMIEEMIGDPEATARMFEEARALVANLVEFPKPIVSAIQGPAVGAGLVAALLSDIPIAARSAKILDGHVKLGVAAGDHAVLVWPLLVGMAKAKYYLFTNEPLTGEEAERIGLVAKVVDDEELYDTALELATSLAAGPTWATRWTKLALNEWYRRAMPAFDASAALEMLSFFHPDAREGLDALLEKRPPRWHPADD